MPKTPCSTSGISSYKYQAVGDVEDLCLRPRKCTTSQKRQDKTELELEISEQRRTVSQTLKEERASRTIENRVTTSDTSQEFFKTLDRVFSVKQKWGKSQNVKGQGDSL